MARPSTLALVPARGGSKSVPLKNIKPLGGRPLIEYVVSAVAASEVVDRICVTTDDERIAAVARSAGAEIPFLRPAEFATDTSSTLDAIGHALAWLDEHEDYRPDLVLLVQPTEPFVRADEIRGALELLLQRDADSAITVVRVPRNFHPFHIRTLDDQGFLEFVDERAHYEHPTRQQDPPRWSFGNLYWFRREAFLAEHRVEVGRRVGLEIGPLTALDLNTPDDWALAEAILAAGIA